MTGSERPDALRGGFAAATAVTRAEEHPPEPDIDERYRAEVPPGWDIAGNVNGGLLAAITARAAADTTQRPDVITITGHFLAPGRPGPLDVTVTPHRLKGRHATSSVTLDSDRRVLAALATCSDLGRARGPEIVTEPPLRLPDPEDCLSSTTEPQAPPFARRIDIRLHPEDAGFRDPATRSGRAIMRGWARLRDDEEIDSFALVQIADAFPPTTFHLPIAQGWTPTLELTVQVRARPVPGWVRCRFRTRYVSQGYLEADGEIWDESDRLVALSRQLALMPLEA